MLLVESPCIRDRQNPVIKKHGASLEEMKIIWKSSNHLSTQFMYIFHALRSILENIMNVGKTVYFENDISVLRKGAKIYRKIIKIKQLRIITVSAPMVFLRAGRRVSTMRMEFRWSFEKEKNPEIGPSCAQFSLSSGDRLDTQDPYRSVKIAAISSGKWGQARSTTTKLLLDDLSRRLATVKAREIIEGLDRLRLDRKVSGFVEVYFDPTITLSNWNLY